MLLLHRKTDVIRTISQNILAMFVKEINDIKKTMENMRSNGLIAQWSLPYESLITNVSNAVFFITPVRADFETKIWSELNKYDYFSFRLNHEKELSSCEYRITFNKEEKIKNLRIDN